MTRHDQIASFLASSGYAAANAEPLAQDASFRRYLRLRSDRPAVLMDAPPPEDVRPFLRIAAHLRGLGLSAPAIIAADESEGLVLEEDLGDELLSVLLDQCRVAAEIVARRRRGRFGRDAVCPPAREPAFVGRNRDGADRDGHAVRLVVARLFRCHGTRRGAA